MTKKPRSTGTDKAERKPRKATLKAPRGARAANAGTVAEGAAPPARGRRRREGTKQEAVIALLRKPDGATIAEIANATNWQPHTTRGFIAGALKKKLGLNVVSEKIEDRGRVYRIPD